MASLILPLILPGHVLAAPKPPTANPIVIPNPQEIGADYVKVTFNLGQGGQGFKLGQESSDPLLTKLEYAVLKGKTIAEAKNAIPALVIPGIVAKSNCKVAVENAGWDQAIDENLVLNENIEYTAQYTVPVTVTSQFMTLDRKFLRVSNASTKLINTATNAEYTFEMSEAGEIQAQDLPLGTYQLSLVNIPENAKLYARESGKLVEAGTLAGRLYKNKENEEGREILVEAPLGENFTIEETPKPVPEEASTSVSPVNPEPVPEETSTSASPVNPIYLEVDQILDPVSTPVAELKPVPAKPSITTDHKTIPATGESRVGHSAASLSLLALGLVLLILRRSKAA